MIRFLDLAKQYQDLKPEIDAAIESVISKAAFIGGDIVAEFETNFSAYQNAEYCIGVANGTDALEIGIEALALPPQSEIIVPANSFIASSEAVTRAGHKVVFADINPDTYLLDPDEVKRGITPATAAVMLVHLYGQPSDIDALMEVSADHGLKVIEDCAQAHGAESAGRRVGTFGDIGTFSFYPGKNLGAYGDAGAIVTNDAEIAKRCRMIANHGRIDKYNHEFEGRNSRLDALQAAILSVKMKSLDQWIEQRIQIARTYSSELSNIAEIETPQVRSDVRHVFHLYVIRAKERDALATHLAENEIQTGVHYPVALPKLKAYEYLGQGKEPMIANRQDANLLSLPIGEHLNKADAIRVSDVIKSFYAK